MVQRTILRLALLTVTLTGSGVGCSLLSASSESASIVVSSPSRSSSISLATDAVRYEWEVSDYTEVFAVGGGDDASFRRGIAELAVRRGISDWEADPDTWLNIGRGLGRAGISEASFMGYVDRWAGNDELRRNLMQKGFEETY
jgi:hypothetical protein